MKRQRNATNAQIWGKKNDSNYDGNCTARHCLSGTYEICRWIFVRLTVHLRPNAVGIVRHFLHYTEVTGSQFDSSCELLDSITTEMYNNRCILEIC